MLLWSGGRLVRQGVRGAGKLRGQSTPDEGVRGYTIFVEAPPFAFLAARGLELGRYEN